MDRVGHHLAGECCSYLADRHSISNGILQNGLLIFRSFEAGICFPGFGVEDISSITFD